MSSPTRESLKALAAVGAIVMMALTGCSSGPADAEAAPQTTTSAAPTTEAVIDKSHVAETTPNPDVTDYRDVTVVRVIDLNHIEVTPAEAEDTLFGKNFTVAVPGYKGPAQDACGFAEAKSFAEDFYVQGNDYVLKYVKFGGPLTQIQDGEHVGDLKLSEADAAAKVDAKMAEGITTTAFDEFQIKDPVAAGFALPAHEELVGLTYDNYLKAAQEKQNGLHKLCPGYGQ